MAKKVVWLCPYDGRDLLVKAGPGFVQRQCPQCGKWWSQGGAPLFAHPKDAVRTLEES